MKFRLRTTARATAIDLRRNVFRDLAQAAAKAADDTVRLARSDIQGVMASRGLGKLSRVVRYSSDLKKRRIPKTLRDGNPQTPWRVGGTVWTREGSDRGLGAFAAYSQGAVIRPVGGGRWLAYPTSNIPKRVGRYKITPSRYNAAGLDKSIGKLVFVQGPSPNVAYLVVKNVGVNRISGQQARRLPLRGALGGSRRVSQFVVAFILIRTTRRAQRFNPLAIMARQAARLPQRLNTYLAGGGGSVSGPVLFSSSGSATGFFLPTVRM